MATVVKIIEFRMRKTKLTMDRLIQTCRWTSECRYSGYCDLVLEQGTHNWKVSGSSLISTSSKLLTYCMCAETYPNTGRAQLAPSEQELIMEMRYPNVT